MKFTELPLKGAYVIETDTFEDFRGTFERLFCKKEFKKADLKKDIVNVNYSLTKKKGTVRGLHYQKPPHSEVKIVKCITGSIYDVIIDLRKGSPTFLQYVGVELSKENGKLLFVPEGFARGFQALEDNTETIYFNTQYYSPEQEGAVNLEDPKIGIKWPIEPSNLSDKDKNHPFLTEEFTGLDMSDKQ